MAGGHRRRDLGRDQLRAVGRPNPDTSPSWAGYVTVGPPLVLLGFVLGTVLFVGLSSRFLKDEDREWMSRAMGAILLFCVGWTGVCAMVLLLPRWALGWRAWGHGALAAGDRRERLAQHARRPRRAAGPRSTKGTARTRLLGLASKLAPPVFLALLAGALSVFTNIISARRRMLRFAGLLGDRRRTARRSRGRITTPC